MDEAQVPSAASPAEPGAPPPLPPPTGAGAGAASRLPLVPDTSALSPAETRRRMRWAAFIAACTGSLLTVAWSLKPATAGFGTHQALGLPACSWPARFGVPCPSCGMTTAFAYATKGDLPASFAAQPMGCILAIATGMSFVASLWTLATGRTVWPVYARFWTARGAWVIGTAALLSWGYKTASMCGWLGP